MGFAVNTHNGTKKEFNEDRISVMLNLTKPANKIDSNYLNNLKFLMTNGQEFSTLQYLMAMLEINVRIF
jgi:hypothetical protein